MALLDQGIGPDDLRWSGLLIPPDCQLEEVWTMGTRPSHAPLCVLQGKGIDHLIKTCLARGIVLTVY